MAKYYAVLNGHSKKPKILTDWASTQKEVTGAKGVLFKSFPTRQEAEDFLRAAGAPKRQPKDSSGAEAMALLQGDAPKEEVLIYVDGSFELETGRYAYGMVVVQGDEEIHGESAAFTSAFSTMRNVAGEVLGAMKAMEYARGKGYAHLHLFFDYQGIESWALGTWKRNNDLTKGYHAFYQELKDELTVTFHKVKGHSGDRFNERADVLAKEAFTK